MNRYPVRILNIIIVAAVGCVGIAGCSYVEKGRQIDYRNTATTAPLDVPPDLTKVPDNTAAGAAATTYSEYTVDKNAAPKPDAPAAVAAAPAPATPASVPAPAPATSSVLPQIPGVQLERDGERTWLVVAATPDALWPYVRSFVLDAGLAIEFENSVTGIIETSWLDNRATTDGKPTAFAKTLSRPLTPGVRDRFRLRLERGKQPGSTNIFLTDQGMTDAAAPAAAGKKPAPKWQPRGADAELEVELLQLLTAYIGPDGPTKGVVVPVAIAPAPSAAPAPAAKPAELTLRKDGREYVFDLPAPADASWKRVGGALERAGFKLTESNAEKYRYTGAYTDATIDKMNRSWLQDTFATGTKKTPPVPYEVYVKPINNASVVSVRRDGGATLTEDLNKYLLSVIFQNLN